MIDYYPPLIPGKYFHVYNHAVSKNNLFVNEENYYFFLEKYAFHLNDFCETYAYCLLPNHFHLLIKIKDESVLKELNNIEKINFENIISKRFSNFFSSYTQAFNKQQNRMGSLFMRPFKRKEITTDDYFNKVLFYIHYNAVHHGLVKNIDDWKYSSWHALSSYKPTRLKRYEIIERFDSIENLVAYHKQVAEEKIALEMEFH